jgi:hypothetical protein
MSKIDSSYTTLAATFIIKQALTWHKYADKMSGTARKVMPHIQ